MPGFFISLEGGEGAGKSTVIAALHAVLAEGGREVVATREPGGTPEGEAIRELLLSPGQHLVPEAELLLMFAARAQLVRQVIRPALARGAAVLADRFTDATFAYQGGGRGFDWQVLGELERMVQALPDGSLRQPDLTVWFDLDPLIAAERLASARVPDKFESQPADFFAAVRAGYARRESDMPNRFARIDAAQTMEAVGADVSRIVRSWLQGSAG